MREIISYYNKVVAHYDSSTLASDISWRSFTFLYHIKNLMEYKKDTKTLSFNTFMNILEADLTTVEKDHPLTILNRDHGKYIVKTMTEKEMNFRELKIIQ
jgi:hypothetical protein